MKSETLEVKGERLGKLACLATFAMCLVLAVQPAFAFKILEPKENAVLKADQPVTVKVDVGRELGVRNALVR